MSDREIVGTRPELDEKGPYPLPADIVSGLMTQRPELIRMAGRNREGDLRNLCFILADVVEKGLELEASCTMKEDELKAHREWRAKACQAMRELAASPLSQ